VQLRKTVTVLFSDIADSTSLGETLDAEVFGRVLQRYFDEVRSVLERMVAGSRSSSATRFSPCSECLSRVRTTRFGRSVPLQRSASVSSS